MPDIGYVTCLGCTATVPIEKWRHHKRRTRGHNWGFETQARLNRITRYRTRLAMFEWLRYDNFLWYDPNRLTGEERQALMPEHMLPAHYQK